MMFKIIVNYKNSRTVIENIRLLIKKAHEKPQPRLNTLWDCKSISYTIVFYLVLCFFHCCGLDFPFFMFNFVISCNHGSKTVSCFLYFLLKWFNWISCNTLYISHSCSSKILVFCFVFLFFLTSQFPFNIMISSL